MSSDRPSLLACAPSLSNIRLPVKKWLEKDITFNVPVTSDDMSAMQVWAHGYDWTYVDEIVKSVSNGTVKYTSFLESLSAIRPVHRTCILTALRNIGLPEDYYLTLKQEVIEAGGDALETVWKLSEMTISRLSFLENWSSEPKVSLFTQFLADWLTLVDIVRIDSAMTSKAYRYNWQHNILRPLQSAGVDKHLHSPQSIDWVRKKCNNIRYLHTKETARSSIGDSCFAEILPHAATSSPSPTPAAHSASDAPAPMFPKLILVELGSENASHCAISTTGVSAIVRGSPMLTSLNLMHCDVNDNGLRIVAKHCPRLTFLSIKYCGKVTDAGILSLVGGCQRLESLDVSWCNKLTDAALKFFGERPLSCLKNLDLSLCTLVTDNGVKSLVKGCPLLRTLSLYACKNISDVALRATAAACPSLVCIKLSLCEKITNDGIISIAKNCPGLKNINLSLCEKLTDAAIIELASRCRRLECLNCYGDKLLTNLSLKALSDHCPDLVSLNLYRCENIGDVGLEYLCALKKLRIINVWNCQQVTPVGFSRCIAELPELISIDVRNCEAISAALLAETKRSLPYLDLDGAINSDKY